MVWNKINPVSTLNLRPHLGGRVCVVIGHKQQFHPHAEKACFSHRTVTGTEILPIIPQNPPCEKA